MSFITRILESILPFLFSALKRSWDNLTTDQQNALVNSGTIGQYLKNNLTVIGDDLVHLISNDTVLPVDVVQNTLIGLAGSFGLTTDKVNEAVAFLQNKLQSAASSSEWNGLLNTLLNAGATILSGGTLDWVHVALGLGEWVYQKFIAPKQVTVLQVPIVSPAQSVAQPAESISVAVPQ